MRRRCKVKYRYTKIIWGVCVNCGEKFLKPSPQSRICSGQCQKERDRKYSRDWRANNKDAARKYAREWERNNKERRNAAKRKKTAKRKRPGEKYYHTTLANELFFYTPDHYRDGIFIGIPSSPIDPVCKFDLTSATPERTERLISDILAGRREYFG